MLDGLEKEIEKLFDRYDRFDSVGIAPPALGVPDGFDARVQMMEFDGADCERSVFLQIVGRREEDLFAPENWFSAYSSFDFYQEVRTALAFKTNFSLETLRALQSLAGFTEKRQQIKCDD